MLGMYLNRNNRGVYRAFSLERESESESETVPSHAGNSKNAFQTNLGFSKLFVGKYQNNETVFSRCALFAEIVCTFFG